MVFERFFKSKDQQKEDETAARAYVAHASGEDVLNKFINASLPDVIDSLLFRVSIASSDDTDVSAFERYAARILQCAGAEQIRSIAAKGPLITIRLPKTNLLWIRFEQDDFEPDERETILLIEAALNRLCFIEKGLKTLLKNNPNLVPDVALCSALDWISLRAIADDSGDYLNRVNQTNEYAVLFGTKALPGGKWDTLTAIVRDCEVIPLPLRLIYTIDVFSEPGTVCVRFAAPNSAAFPHSQWSDQKQQWIDTSSQLTSEAAHYMIRVAIRLAAICFGANVEVTRVVVNAYDAASPNANQATEEDNQAEAILLSIDFNRLHFLNITMPALQEKKLSSIQTEGDCELLLKLAAPTAWHMNVADDGSLLPVEPIEIDSMNCYLPLSDDERELPSDLAELFRANKVCDLDVMSDQDPETLAHMRAIIADSDDSPLLAIAQLEELVNASEKEDAAALEAAPAGSIPLFCQAPFARYTVSLISDNPNDRYVRISDVGYLSREALVDLYIKIGDANAALAQAQRCVELAPSSPSAYLNLANVYSSFDCYEKAIAPLIDALRLEAIQDNYSYIYYRLAFALWKTGRLEEGLACYLRVRTSNARLNNNALTEQAALLEELGWADCDDFDGDAALRAGGIPLAPTTKLRDLVAKECIWLCDASIPVPDVHVVKILGHILNNDVMRMTARSLETA